MNIPLYLAPMDDITDRAFRELCKENGADFVFTEFVAADSLIREVDKSFKKITFSDIERPLGIQIFGNNVKSMVEAAKIAEKYNPDEININCGCPVKKIVNKGCGSALLKDIDNLIDIVKNVVNIINIPISVKTRLGWDENNIIIEDLVLRLQDIGVKKVIIHCRTRSQMYSGKADYSYLKKIKDNKNITISIIGNGDVVDCVSYKNMVDTNVDGVMIGRGSIGNPWIFNDLKCRNFNINDLNNDDFIKNDDYKLKLRPLDEILKMIRRHIDLSLKYNEEWKTILSLRKHYSGYFKNIPNSKVIRLKLMNFEKIDELLDFIDNFKYEV